MFETKKKDSPIKIIDFGISRHYKSHEKMHQKAGTVYFIAPEVIKKSYDEKCDIWSCGVIFYLLLCGYPPFAGKNEKEIMDNVLIGHYILNGKEWDSVSLEAKIFVKNLLQYDPQKRPTAIQALNDKWIQENCKKNRINKPIACQVFENLQTFEVNCVFNKKIIYSDFLYIYILGEKSNSTRYLDFYYFKFD